MEFLKAFAKHNEYSVFTGTSEFVKPNVSYCIAENENHYNPYVHDYSQDYLTFTALEDGTFNFSGNPIDYSIDEGQTWVSLPSSTNTPIIQAGNKIIWKMKQYPTSSKGIGRFSSSGSFNVEGNIMSIVSGDSFSNVTTTVSYQFMCLFSGCTNIVEAKNLIIPASTMSTSACTKMFYGCTSLTTAPELPATNVESSGGYRLMFCGCSKLKTAPVIAASSFGYCTCHGMFSGCTSLTTAPVLSATTIGRGRYGQIIEGCYSWMFANCTSLTTAPELPATNLSGANWCYYFMFAGCRNLITPPTTLPATNLSEGSYAYMFSNCTSLRSAPNIMATTLSWGSCRYMFSNCTSLTTAPSVLPATDLSGSSYCYQGMFSGCTSLTNAPQLPSTALPAYSSSHSSGGAYQNMFAGCTSLTTAPVLPSTTLKKSCYKEMFSGCTSLNSVTCLATDISASNCTNNWVIGVAESGTFTKAASITSWTTGESGIPDGWTVQDAS